MNPFDFFFEAARRYPDRLALVDDAESLSFRAAIQRVEAFANALVMNGVKAGTRVGVFYPNCVDCLVAALAVFRVGAVWVPINARNSDEQNALYVKRAAVEFLVFHKDYSEHAEEIARDAALPRVTIVPEINEVSSQLEPRSPDAGTVCAMLSTGGTTGSPKSVVWTERTVQTMIASFSVHISVDQNSSYLAVTPLTHAAGVIAFCVLARGSSVVIHKSFNVDRLLETIEAKRISHLFLPPTAIYALLNHPDLGQFDLSSLRAFIYSAAPMASEKIKQAVAAFGPVMIQLYGQAEVPLMCSILTPADHSLGLTEGNEHLLRSCGRSTLLVQIEIMDEYGKLLGPGEVGEVVLRGDLVMQGYFNHSEETSYVSRYGWHHTGDIGFKDEVGYLSIVDRAKDMIISGGFNVFSSEVEEVVLSHPAVLDCAVVGRPDEKWGEAVTAVIEVKTETEFDVEELISYCRERLGAVKAPKSVEIWNELPRSPVGKVLKREVRETFWKGLSRRV